VFRLRLCLVFGGFSKGRRGGAILPGFGGCGMLRKGAEIGVECASQKRQRIFQRKDAKVQRRKDDRLGAKVQKSKSARARRKEPGLNRSMQSTRMGEADWIADGGTAARTEAGGIF